MRLSLVKSTPCQITCFSARTVTKLLRLSRICAHTLRPCTFIIPVSNVQCVRRYVPRATPIESIRSVTIAGRQQNCKTCHLKTCSEMSLFLGFQALDEKISSKVVYYPDEQVFKCTECDYYSVTKRHVLNHIESKHITHPGASCAYCFKACPTREALRKHVSRFHRPPPH